MRNSKKLLKVTILSLSLLLALPAVAGGVYDGVWTLNSGTEADNDYYVIYQNGSTLLLISNYAATDGWEAWTGQMDSGDKATLSTIINGEGVNSQFTIEFSSLTNATITLESCVPAIECDGIPVGVPISASKFF